MPCISGYRYCGPGCSGPGAPTNQLDAICREHDICYKRTRNHQQCDQVYLRNLEPYLNYRGKLGRDARLMYRAIRLKTMF
ncbi:Parvovirus coat protein VP1-like protein [Radiobacillus sp. PE A8.2]|uniref:Parvovirus coat protein VP1-like protein n=1 Tax=Radiobacillus sp. PE A8.2 TaxID=3380349 RepID=UPI00388F5D85